MLGDGQFTLETCCGYGCCLMWTFPSPGWPQTGESSLGTVGILPGAPDGFSRMGYISTLGTLRHLPLPLWIWASEFISPRQLVKSSRDHKPSVLNSFFLVFRTDWPTFNPKLQPPCMRYKRPRPLHALQEASTSPAHLTGDLSPLCNLGETLKTPFLRVPFADQAVHP